MSLTFGEIHAKSRALRSRPAAILPGMDAAIVLDRVEFSSVEVTAHTRWHHVQVFDARGASVVIEYSEVGESDSAATIVGQTLRQLHGKAIHDESAIVGALGADPAGLPPRHPLTIAVSAVRSAVSGLQAAHQRLSLTESLGGTPAESVELYANINRSLLTRERTASSFAAEAERAAARGFTIIKCAPFDEVEPPLSAASVLQRARPGIDRVAAVRAAVGPDVRVLVDCHSRFDLGSAPHVAEELARLDIGWFEEPVDPVSARAPLVEIAARVSMPVAGGESGYGEPFFSDLLRKNAVSVIMPDVKFCGGVVEAYRAGKTAAELGRGFSLHSPAGPASLLASAHVTAAVPGAMALEHAVNEAPWRAELLDPPERIERGRLWFPGGAGLGATLNRKVVDRYGRRWST